MLPGITRRIVARESDDVFILVQPTRRILTQDQNNGPKHAFIKLSASFFGSCLKCLLGLSSSFKVSKS